jgi:folate-dependent tRNA-U54 methylase TrmFO/GidA
MKNKNFALKADAKVFQMIPGFEPVPFSKMGIYRDKYRK